MTPPIGTAGLTVSAVAFRGISVVCLEESTASLLKKGPVLETLAVHVEGTCRGSLKVLGGESPLEVVQTLWGDLNLNPFIFGEE